MLPVPLLLIDTSTVLVVVLGKVSGTVGSTDRPLAWHSDDTQLRAVELPVRVTELASKISSGLKNNCASRPKLIVPPAWLFNPSGKLLTHKLIDEQGLVTSISSLACPSLRA